MKPYELAEWNDLNDICESSDYISICCGAPALGEMYDHGDGIMTGFCSSCKDHTTFENEMEE